VSNFDHLLGVPFPNLIEVSGKEETRRMLGVDRGRVFDRTRLPLFRHSAVRARSLPWSRSPWERAEARAFTAAIAKESSGPASWGTATAIMSSSPAGEQTTVSIWRRHMETMIATVMPTREITASAQNA
jgi:hypothetical protein